MSFSLARVAERGGDRCDRHDLSDFAKRGLPSRTAVLRPVEARRGS